MSILQRLYDSEINFMIEAMWDGGFIVKLGDVFSGYVAETRLDSIIAVEEWLAEQAAIHYPNSEFAKGTKPR